jgi:hypothetical protein
MTEVAKFEANLRTSRAAQTNTRQKQAHQRAPKVSKKSATPEPTVQSSISVLPAPKTEERKSVKRRVEVDAELPELKKFPNLKLEASNPHDIVPVPVPDPTTRIEVQQEYGVAPDGTMRGRPLFYRPILHRPHKYGSAAVVGREVNRCVRSQCTSLIEYFSIRSRQVHGFQFDPEPEEREWSDHYQKWKSSQTFHNYKFDCRTARPRRELNVRMRKTSKIWIVI